MIEIKKDNTIRFVTKGVYENLYKKLGFEPVGDKKVEKPVEQIKVEEKKEEVKEAPASKNFRK